jgi:hypothetical protein
LTNFSLFLEEATIHFRKAFPDLVRFNPEPILFAFARMFKIFVQQRGIGSSVIPVFTYTENDNDNKKNEIQNE